MSYSNYTTLREQPASKLADINKHVEALLAHEETLPEELRIRLDTFRADISAAMEDLKTSPSRPGNVTTIRANTSP